MTSAEFKALMDQYLAEYVAGGHYTSRWSGEEIDEGVAGGLQLGGAGSKQEAIYNLGVKSNPNFLDNWYFARPVNQLGASTYDANWSWVYSIDRWRTQGPVTLADGCAEFTFAGGMHFQQVTEFLSPGIYTLSYLLDSGGAGIACLAGTSLDNYQGNVNCGIGGLGEVTFAVTEDITNAEYSVMGNTPSGLARIRAIKLERGDHQTLARQDADGNWVLLDPPPDYGQELAKCQRYFCRVKSRSGSLVMLGLAQAISSTSISLFLPLPVEMRASPSVSASSISKIIFTRSTVSNGIPATAIESSNFGGSTMAIAFNVSGQTPLNPGDTYRCWISSSVEALDINSNL